MRDLAATLARIGQLLELARGAGADGEDCRAAFDDCRWMADELESRLTKPSTREIRLRLAQQLRRLRGRDPAEQGRILAEQFSSLSRSAFYRHLQAVRAAEAVPVPSGTPARSNAEKQHAHRAEG